MWGNIPSRTVRVSSETGGIRELSGSGNQLRGHLFHKHREMVLSRLRQWERDKHTKRLIALPKQGVVMSCVGLARASSHFLTTDDYTRIADWRFVHMARLGVLPLNAYKKCPTMSALWV
jgi:hypothetical protein